MLIKVLTLIISSTFFSANALAKTISADNKKIVYEGRFIKAPDGNTYIGYSGVTMHVNFKGHRLELYSNATTSNLYLDVIIDDGEPKRIHLKAGKHNTVLFEGQKGVHSAKIVKRTETWQAIWQPIELTAPKGKFLKAAKLPTRKILAIGDSMSAGSAVDIREGEEPNGHHNDNGRLSFACVLARKLNAQCHLVAYGGRGIIRDWQGSTTTNNAPVYYERTLADDPNSPWDHSQYQADAVIIELGQNDFTVGFPDQKAFVDTYVKLVKKVQTDMPNAYVFIMQSPMQGNKTLDRKVLDYYLDQILKKLKYKNVQKLKVGFYPGRGSVNGHPTASEHADIAEKIAPTIQKALRWSF